MRALKRQGLVNVKPTRRGAGIVSLTQQIAQTQDPRTLAQRKPEGEQSAA